MRTRPIIGVTLDAEEPGGYSKLPWYALRKNYFAALAEAGALPVALPHHAELAEAYLDQIDGLLITGGAFDVDPSLYGEGSTHPTVTLKAGRTDFELAVTRGALASSTVAASSTARVPSLPTRVPATSNPRSGSRCSRE